MGGRGKGAVYRCRVNTRRLVFDEAANYAYPWRDNFCESRDFFVGQCPSGLGHQGQDIRPAWCAQRNEGADRCMPYQHDVVAVADGALLRPPGDMALYLVVNRPGEHVRFRYLHMSPKMLDEAELWSGREVQAGEVIGKVGNYFRRPGGTSYHLHFDIQVPTRHGWEFVNPYMTWGAAYERLIGGRGDVVTDAAFEPPKPPPATEPPEATPTGEPAAPAVAQRKAEPPVMAIVALPRPAPRNARLLVDDAGKRIGENAKKDKRERDKLSTRQCKASVAKGARGRHCDARRSDSGARAKHARAVRSVDRHVPHKGERARHRGRDVHKGHARAKARHGRV
jgi:hypothetical protein